MQEDDVYAAVASAAFGGGVGCYGVELGVAGYGELRGVGVAVLEKEAGDGRGAGAGEFPVGGVERGVLGKIVGVTFDADGRRGQRICEGG